MPELFFADFHGATVIKNSPITVARETGARLPLMALVDQFYADVQAMDGERWDTSSLIRRLSDVY